MKWTIIVMLLGSHPMDTGLMFDTLTACGERAVKLQEGIAYSATSWLNTTGIPEQPYTMTDEQYAAAYKKNREQRVLRSSGADNVLTCVPRSSDSENSRR